MKWSISLLGLLAASLYCQASTNRFAVGQPSIFWHNGEWQTYQDGVWTPYFQSAQSRLDQEANRGDRPWQHRRGKAATQMGPVGAQGSSVGIGQPNGIGETTIGIGQTTIGIGQPTIGIGQPNSIGQTTIGIGQPTIGIGKPNGIGQTTIGIGQPNVTVGPPNVGIGQTTIGIGQPTIGIGKPNTGFSQPPAPDRNPTPAPPRPEPRGGGGGGRRGF